MSKYFIGQKVFSLNIGNAARHRPQELTPYVITKVGRKYFYAMPEGSTSTWSEQTYHTDSGVAKTEYSADSCIYISEQEWLDEKEAATPLSRIKENFRYGSLVDLNLEALRKIDAILTSAE